MTIVRIKQNVLYVVQQPYLTPAEEQHLADWAVQMGYGCTKEQISAAVNKRLDRDGRQLIIIPSATDHDITRALAACSCLKGVL